MVCLVGYLDKYLFNLQDNKSEKSLFLLHFHAYWKTFILFIDFLISAYVKMFYVLFIILINYNKINYQ